MSDFKQYCRNRIKYNFFRWIFLGIIALIIYAISGALTMGYVYALTTETIYATNSNCTFSDNGKYKNISSNGTISTNSINTTYNGKSYGMQFYFAEDMITTKVYQLKITFMADDLLPRVNENFISLITFDTSCEQDYATILSIEKNTSSGNATTMTVNFIPSMVSNKAVILIGSPSGPTQITGETTFGIKKVEIGDRESQGNEQIIINQNQNTQEIINNQNQNAQDIQDTINSNLQEDCKNLLNNTLSTTSVNGVTYTVNEDKSITLSGTATSFSYVLLNRQDNLHGVYTISGGSALGQNIFMRGLNIDNGFSVDIQTQPTLQGTANLNGNYVFYLYVAQGTNTNGITIYPQLKEGYNTIPYCAYGSKVSKIDETNNAINEVNETSKGILGKIGDLIGYINPMSDNFFLKIAFIPSQSDMQSLIDDLKLWFEGKFGVLGQGISIFINILDNYNNLSDENDVIIHVPNIKVPNFESTNINIIQAQDFNWSALLRSKQELSNLWTLYLDFVDVYLWFALINFCLDLLEDILGERSIHGDDVFESEGESYDVDSKTGEVSNRRIWNKTTRRKR